MLTGVTITCFLLSYLTVFAIEASRLLLKLPGRNALVIGMLIAGLIAHTLFLINEFTGQTPNADQAQLLANWFQWIVLGAWGLALACLVLTFRNPNGSMSLFLIPMILGLIGVARFLEGSRPFQAETTIGVWRAIHGVSQLVGAMFICFGLTFGIMYLVQSHRLKSKTQSKALFKLPTLEFLQSMNRLSLFASAVALAFGLLSAVVLNLDKAGNIAWFSSVIVFTFALFAWVLVAAILEWISAGSLGGRRSAYLVIANFLFFVVVLVTVLVSAHGQIESGVKELGNSSFEDEFRSREVIS
jgi:hypothetical protein